MIRGLRWAGRSVTSTALGPVRNAAQKFWHAKERAAERVGAAISRIDEEKLGKLIGTRWAKSLWGGTRGSTRVFDVRHPQITAGKTRRVVFDVRNRKLVTELAPNMKPRGEIK